MTWIPQPESGPDTLPAGATVAGVRVTTPTPPLGLRHAHGSAEGLAERVARNRRRYVTSWEETP